MIIPRSTLPTDIPGLGSWHDASRIDESTIVSDRFSQINDLSGNSFHLTQTQASTRPTTGEIGGRRAVLHDGSSVVNINDIPLSRDIDAFTMVGVVRIDSSSGFPMRWFVLQNNAAGQRLGMSVGENAGGGGNSDLRTTLGGRSTDASSFIGLGPSPNNTINVVVGIPFIQVNTFDYINGIATIHKDGALAASTSSWHKGRTSNTDSNGLFIGATNTAGSSSLVGAWGEIMTFNRVLSDFERRCIEWYLTKKWNSPPSASFISRLETPGRASR